MRVREGESVCVRAHGCERRERVWVDKEQKICPTYINVCSSQVKANDSCILLFLLLSFSLSSLSLVTAAVPENFN